MGRLCETEGLSEDQTEILKAVRTYTLCAKGIIGRSLLGEDRA